MPPRRAAAPPPPTDQRPTAVAAGLVALGLGAQASGTVAAPATSVATAKQVADKIVDVGQIALLIGLIRSFYQRKEREDTKFLVGMLREEYPEEPEGNVAALARREIEYERSFQRRSLQRLERDLTAASGIADATKRIERIRTVLDREHRYAQMRDKAMVDRSISAMERDLLKRISPQGAYWKLSKHVKEHTLDCLFMGGKFWPWAVLDLIHPPLHAGCPCELYGHDEAIERRYMKASDPLPETGDAMARAKAGIERARALSESLSLEEVDAYLEELEEADYYDLRYPAGSPEGGRFRPRGANIPGVRSLARRALRGLLPRAPSTRDKRAPLKRGQWIKGRFIQIPEDREWRKKVGGVEFRSPAGSTNIYREGQLVAGPLTEPRHHDVMRPSKGERLGLGITPEAVPEVDTEAQLEDIREELSKTTAELTRPHRHRVAEALRKLDPSVKPVIVGDEALFHMALEDAGFRMIAHYKANEDHYSFDHAASGSHLHVSFDRGTGKVVGVEWEPQAYETGRREYLDHTPTDGEAWTGDLLGWADRVAEVEDESITNAARARIDADTPDHSGFHRWDGEIILGRGWPTSLANDAGRKGRSGFDDTHAAEMYTAYQVTAHEVSHATNLPNGADYTSSFRALEESLTEEVSHELTMDRLREHGRTDLLEWAQTHVTSDRRLGSYHAARAALDGILTDAGIDPADRRDTLFDLKFRIPPDERMEVLAAAIHAHRNPGAEWENVPRDERIRAIREIERRMVVEDHAERDFVPSLAGDAKGAKPRPRRTKVTASDLRSELEIGVGDDVTLHDGVTGKVLEIDSEAEFGAQFRILLDEPVTKGGVRQHILSGVSNFEIASVAHRDDATSPTLRMKGEAIDADGRTFGVGDEVAWSLGDGDHARGRVISTGRNRRNGQPQVRVQVTETDNHVRMAPRGQVGDSILFEGEYAGDTARKGVKGLDSLTITKHSDPDPTEPLTEGDTVYWRGRDGKVRSGKLERIVRTDSRWWVQVRKRGGPLLNITPDRIDSDLVHERRQLRELRRSTGAAGPHAPDVRRRRAQGAGEPAEAPDAPLIQIANLGRRTPQDASERRAAISRIKGTGTDLAALERRDAGKEVEWTGWDDFLDSEPVGLYAATNARGTPGFDKVVRERGRAYELSDERDEMEGLRGTPKECYKNALMASVAHPDYKYVEGYVRVKKNLPYPVQHGWVEDSDGKALEVTLDPDEVVGYYGVPVDQEVAIKAALGRGLSGPSLEWPELGFVQAEANVPSLGAGWKKDGEDTWRNGDYEIRRLQVRGGTVRGPYGRGYRQSTTKKPRYFVSRVADGERTTVATHLAKLADAKQTAENDAAANAHPGYPRAIPVRQDFIERHERLRGEPGTGAGVYRHVAPTYEWAEGPAGEVVTPPGQVQVGDQKFYVQRTERDGDRIKMYGSKLLTQDPVVEVEADREVRFGREQRGMGTALERQAERLGFDSVEDYEAATDATLEKLLDPSESHVAVRVWPEVLERLVEPGGKLVNAHHPDHVSPTGDHKEAHQGKDPDYVAARAEEESKVFDGQHPVYGYLADDGEDVTDNVVKAFGTIKLKLGPGVRGRSTFTYSDSVFAGVFSKATAIPRPVNDPDNRAVPYFADIIGVERLTMPHGVRPNPDPPEVEGLEGEARERKLMELEDAGKWRRWPHRDFFEAQIFGDVTLADVEEAIFPSDQPPSEEMREKLEGAGVRWRVDAPDQGERHPGYMPQRARDRDITEADVQEIVEALSFEHEPTGLKVTDVNYRPIEPGERGALQSGAQVWRVWGSIHQNGVYRGEFIREVSREGVYRDRTYLEDDVRGGGFGTEFLNREVRAYRNLGIPEITVDTGSPSAERFASSRGFVESGAGFWVLDLDAPESERVTVVAIDGPSGSGKSPTARMVAERVGGTYIDSGAFYRVAGHAILANKDPVAAVREATPEDLADPKLRTPEVDMLASDVGKRRDVTAAVHDRLREIVDEAEHTVVIDGRDSGEVLNAGTRIYLTADDGERALRRGRLQGTSAADAAKRLADRDARDAGKLERAKAKGIHVHLSEKEEGPSDALVAPDADRAADKVIELAGLMAGQANRPDLDLEWVGEGGDMVGRLNRGEAPLEVGDDLSKVQLLIDRLGFEVEGRRYDRSKNKVAYTLRRKRDGMPNERMIVHVEVEEGPLHKPSLGKVSRVNWEEPELGSVRSLNRSEVERVRGRMAKGRPELRRDLLARVDELGERYGANTHATHVANHPQVTGHNGSRGWDGEVILGIDVEPDIEQFRRDREEGLHPSSEVGDEFVSGEERYNERLAKVYSAYHTMQHEVSHAINPIDRADYDMASGGRALEEALTEEVSHELTDEWLRDHGLDEVADWALANPRHRVVAGTYQGFRSRLKEILDRAEVPQEDRAELLHRMKFEMSHSRRVSTLAELLVEAGAEPDINAARLSIRNTLRPIQGTEIPNRHAGFVPILGDSAVPTRDFSIRIGPDAAEGMGDLVRVRDQVNYVDDSDGISLRRSGRVAAINPPDAPGMIVVNLDDGETITAPPWKLRWYRPSNAIAKPGASFVGNHSVGDSVYVPRRGRTGEVLSIDRHRNVAKVRYDLGDGEYHDEELRGTEIKTPTTEQIRLRSLAPAVDKGNPNEHWEPVPANERPKVLYHGTRTGQGGIEKRGLRRRKSKHRDEKRDTESLVFLWPKAISAETYAGMLRRKGDATVYEVDLPEDAPLYRDTKLTGAGAMFTNVDISPERVRRMTQEELVERTRDEMPEGTPNIVDLGRRTSDEMQAVATGARAFTQRLAEEHGARSGLTRVTTAHPGELERESGPGTMAYYNWGTGEIVLHDQLAHAISTLEARERAGGFAHVGGNPFMDNGHIDDYNERWKLYAAYQVLAHELSHSVNPITLSLMNDDNRALEEALTEETSHITADRWLREIGLDNLADMRRDNPNEPPARGTYLVWREGLATILREDLNVPDEDMEDVLFELKFRVPPSQRYHWLAERIEQADKPLFRGMSREGIVDYLQKRMRPAPGQRPEGGYNPMLSPNHELPDTPLEIHTESFDVPETATAGQKAASNIRAALHGHTDGEVTAVVQPSASPDDKVVRVGFYRNSNSERVGHFIFAVHESSTGKLVIEGPDIQLVRHKNKGFVGGATEQAMDAFKEAGIEAINVEAVNVGSYAWARMGFSFDENVTAKDLLERWRDHRTPDHDVFAIAREFVPEEVIQGLIDGIENGTITEPWQIAEYGREHPWRVERQRHEWGGRVLGNRGSEDVVWHLGKFLLMQTSWSGRLEL